MMDRESLQKLKLEALRLLAQERGIDGARGLGKAELIDQLAPRSFVDKVQATIDHAVEVVDHAVERVEERAHALAERLHHRQEPPPASPAHGDDVSAAAAGETSGDEGKAQAAHATDSPTATAALARGHNGAGHDVVHRVVSTHEAPPLNQGHGLGPRRHDGASAPAAPMHRPTPTPQPAAQEPMGLLDLEELPELYGVDECELLYKDPFWVFVYWEVTDGGLQAARAQLGQSAENARLVLRLFTTVATANGVDRQTLDVDLTWNHGRRYLQAPRSGAHLRVAVGLLSKEGYFAPIAHSSLVRVPPAAPQPGPVEWMEVVPPSGRGREPIVIVPRGGQHAERGVTPGAGELAQASNAAGTSPTAPAARPGQPGWPFSGSSPAFQGSSFAGSSWSASSPTRSDRHEGGR